MNVLENMLKSVLYSTDPQICCDVGISVGPLSHQIFLYCFLYLWCFEVNGMITAYTLF